MTADHVALTIEDILAETDALRALARRLLGDDHAAEDAVSHTVGQALRVQPARASLVAFLRRTLRNRATDHARRAAARRRAENAAATAGDVPSAAEMAGVIEARGLVADAVLRLEPGLRDVVWLHYYEAQTMPSLATRLGIPLDTAKSRLRRALATLRASLAQRAPSWRGALLPLAALPARTVRWPWWLAGLTAVTVGLTISWRTAPEAGTVVPLGFEWLSAVEEVRVLIPREGQPVERLRYARVLPASTFTTGDASLLWDREGTLGEDRFIFDAAAGEWRVRLGSTVAARNLELRGSADELHADDLRVTWRTVPTGRLAEIAQRGDDGAWQIVERAVFRLRQR